MIPTSFPAAADGLEWSGSTSRRTRAEPPLCVAGECDSAAPRHTQMRMIGTARDARSCRIESVGYAYAYALIGMFTRNHAGGWRGMIGSQRRYG